jgi:hypothetical protein
MLGWVKILYFASELGLELGSIEMGDGACATHTVLGVGPGGFNIVAQRADGAKAGYNYSF